MFLGSLKAGSACTDNNNVNVTELLVIARGIASVGQVADALETAGNQAVNNGHDSCRNHWLANT